MKPYNKKNEGLTAAEKEEFKQLKMDLLEYHQYDCTHYNPKKVRYDELWDKNAKATFEGLKFFETINKQMDEN